jgi:hypothetical protein
MDAWRPPCSTPNLTAWHFRPGWSQDSSPCVFCQTPTSLWFNLVSGCGLKSPLGRTRFIMIANLGMVDYCLVNQSSKYENLGGCLILLGGNGQPSSLWFQSPSSYSRWKCYSQIMQSLYTFSHGWICKSGFHLLPRVQKFSS